MSNTINGALPPTNQNLTQVRVISDARNRLVEQLSFIPPPPGGAAQIDVFRRGAFNLVAMNGMPSYIEPALPTRQNNGSLEIRNGSVYHHAYPGDPNPHLFNREAYRTPQTILDNAAAMLVGAAGAPFLPSKL